MDDDDSDALSSFYFLRDIPICFQLAEKLVVPRLKD